MISLSNVTKRYGEGVAVDRLSLEVGRGEVCVLIGPSGCGKSTTLRMINGLVPADGGRIEVDGRSVADTDAAELRRGIGYVIQSGGLFPHWTVAANVAAVPRLLRWPRGRIEERVRDMLRLVGLEPGEFMGRFPHQLSGGQQQRVGVARALAADPPVLLMDEPFGALDPATRRSLQNELLAIHQRTGKTIVLVTHDMEEALRLADRIVVMERGRVVQDDRPNRIVTRPVSDLVRGLVGSEEGVLRLLGRSTVADAMRASAPRGGGSTIGAGATLAVALARLLVDGRGELVVTDGEGRPIGLLSLNDVSKAIER